MQINNEMADSIFFFNVITCLSFLNSRPNSHVWICSSEVFLLSVVCHTPFRNSGLSRDQFCHTLLGAAVMEGAVKVTSGAAYSRWEPRLRGGGQPT